MKRSREEQNLFKKISIEEHKYTTLVIACQNGEVDVVAFLIEKGADIDKVSGPFNETPLFAACKGNHIGVVEYLLERGADKDKVSGYKNETPLLLACEMCHLDLVVLLVTAGADIDKKASTEHGKSPLIAACDLGDLDMVSFLVNQGADIEQACRKHGKTPLIMACDWGLLDMVTLFVDRGVDIEKAGTHDGRTPLIAACGKGRLDVVQLLVKKGAEKDKPSVPPSVIPTVGIWQCPPRYPRWTPISIACSEGHLEIVRFLFSEGIDINHAALPAVEISDADRVDRVKRGYQRPEVKGHIGWNPPLYEACLRGRSEVVRFLLSKGVDRDNVSDNGITPLFVVCSRKHLELVETLLTAGADTNKGIMSGPRILVTPLHDVLTVVQIESQAGGRGLEHSDSEYWKIAEFLVKQGADINYLDHEGRTPLDLLPLDDPRRSQLQDLHNFYLEEVSCLPVLK